MGVLFIAAPESPFGVLQLVPHAPDTTYDALWLHYLRAHSLRLTRLIHYLGITTIFAGIAAAVIADTWWYGVAGLVAGYLIAFSAHYTVQHNRPVLFEGPRATFWSAGCALRMYFLGITGQLGAHLQRAGVDSSA